jgi:nitrogen fixation/metabolism regulation signal transduction histidine kinase
MNSIRKKIQLMLVVSIAVISVVALTILSINQLNVLKNQKILETMTTEYTIISLSEKLAEDYNAVVKNPNNEQFSNAYRLTREKLMETLAFLRQEIKNEESRLLMVGVENTVNQVVAETDAGLAEINEGNFQNFSEHFVLAHKYNEYVLNNTRSLLQKELEYLSQTQEESQKTYFFTATISVITFLVIVILMIHLGNIFSKQITIPLVQLSHFAEEVSGGNFQNRTKQNLAISNDEIGSLTHSVFSMVDKLTEMIAQTEQKNEEMKKTDALVQKNNMELEKMNSYMIGRELKMIQLKKKIRELEALNAKPQ